MPPRRADLGISENHYVMSYKTSASLTLPLALDSRDVLHPADDFLDFFFFFLCSILLFLVLHVFKMMSV